MSHTKDRLNLYMIEGAQQEHKKSSKNRRDAIQTPDPTENRKLALPSSSLYENENKGEREKSPDITHEASHTNNTGQNFTPKDFQVPQNDQELRSYNKSYFNERRLLSVPISEKRTNKYILNSKKSYNSVTTEDEIQVLLNLKKTNNMKKISEVTKIENSTLRKYLLRMLNDIMSLEKTCLEQLKADLKNYFLDVCYDLMKQEIETKDRDIISALRLIFPIKLPIFPIFTYLPNFFFTLNLKENFCFFDGEEQEEAIRQSPLKNYVNSCNSQLFFYSRIRLSINTRKKLTGVTFEENDSKKSWKYDQKEIKICSVLSEKGMICSAVKEDDIFDEKKFIRTMEDDIIKELEKTKTPAIIMISKIGFNPINVLKKLNSRNDYYIIFLSQEHSCFNPVDLMFKLMIEKIDSLRLNNIEEVMQSFKEYLKKIDLIQIRRMIDIRGIKIWIRKYVLKEKISLI